MENLKLVKINGLESLEKTVRELINKIDILSSESQPIIEAARNDDEKWNITVEFTGAISYARNICLFLNEFIDNTQSTIK